MLCPFCEECDENFDHIFSCSEGFIYHINDKIHDISEFINIESNRLMKSIMLLLTASAVHTRKYLLRSMRHDVTINIFAYGSNSRLIRALLYSKTTKSQCFLLLLWTEVQPVHTPVRTQAYGLALSQSNFSILSVFCLVYNNSKYMLKYEKYREVII